MITRGTKIQLVLFVIIVLVGATFVGGRYAQIDRLFLDRTFEVTADFEESGGIFKGAEVTYRGIAVGEVGRLDFTQDGVDVILSIENDAPKISDDVRAVVANKSAIGEQFVDLQPRGSSAPYLQQGTEIPRQDTEVPIDTTTLLLNLNSFVSSVDTDDLQTVVTELGAAFEGTGADLERIISTSTEFIETAQENLAVTQRLIRNSSGVLQTQIDKQSELQIFSNNLALLSDTLVDADPDIRRLLDEGTPSARVVREVIDENAADLQTIFSDLVSASKPLADNRESLQVLSILYPYLLEGSFSVIAPSKRVDGEMDATFGLVITAPGSYEVCSNADGDGDPTYRPRRDPADLRDIPFNVDVDCTVEEKKPPRTPSRTEFNRSDPNRIDRAAAGDQTLGKDSWQWLLLGPATR